jgi:hypothetical protein
MTARDDGLGGAPNDPDSPLPDSSSSLLPHAILKGAGDPAGGVVGDAEDLASEEVEFEEVEFEDEEPPDWLVGLIDEIGVVAADDPVRAVRELLPSSGLPEAGAEPTADTATYFCVVGGEQAEEIVGIHALSWDPDDPLGVWWTFEGEDWLVDDFELDLSGGLMLRWIPSGPIEYMVAQERDREARMAVVADNPDVLREVLELTLEEEEIAGITTTFGYIEWRGAGPDLLALEAGDGRDYEVPLPDAFVARLVRLGWEAPDRERRNAWFEAAGPRCVDTSLNLIARTMRDFLEEPYPSE